MRVPPTPTKQRERPAGAPAEEPQENPPEAAPKAPPAPAAKQPPPLREVKTQTATTFEEKFVVIHGPNGVGKSTLASQWAGGEVFFFNCSGELGEFEVYQQAITDWTEFRSYAWALKENPSRFKAAAIDTGDMLGKYCSTKIRKDLGIVHESDLDWGKGWGTLRDEFQTNLAKLIWIPNVGTVVVIHSDEKEVKTRSATWNKWEFRGFKAIRETLMDMSDIVLFVDFADDDDSEKRVIKTKPSRYHDAKERGLHPRLPAEIEWPLGEDGFALLKAAWEAGGQEKK